MNIPDMIRVVQHKYGLKEDGVAGIATWTAIYKNEIANVKDVTSVDPSTPPIVLPPSPKVDDRSERIISTLHEKVRPYARSLIIVAAQHGITIKATSGLRTYKEQDELYEQGRSKPGKIVTNAHGGYSNHNFGIAFDVTIFDSNDKPVYESPLYKAVGAFGMNLGLTWGGNWVNIEDEPHFELHPSWAEKLTENVMLAQLRARHESGKDMFV